MDTIQKNQSMDSNYVKKQAADADAKFTSQLNDTIEVYPNYQIDKDTTYPTKLSILNGITKKINFLQSLIDKKNVNLERNISFQGAEIEKYKEIEKNLENVTSIKDLDATSKKMLSDSVEEYRNYTIEFWIKVIAILIVTSTIVRTKQYRQGLFLLGLSVALLFIYMMYKYFRT
jgi:hypothetical protein